MARFPTDKAKEKPISDSHGSGTGKALRLGRLRFGPRESRAKEGRRNASIVLMRELIRCSPRLAGTLGLVVITSAALPVATVVATGKLVGAVHEALRDSASGVPVRLGALVLAVGLLYVTGQLMGALQRPIFFLTGSRFTLYLREMVESATVRPVGIAHLEDPLFKDEVALVDGIESGNWPPAQIVSGLSMTLVGWLAGLGLAALLGGFAWWAPLLILLSFWPIRRWIARDVAVFVEAAERSSTDLRRSTYLRSLATGPEAAKEVRIFGLSSFVAERFAHQWLQAMKKVWRARKGNRWLVVQGAAAQAFAYGLVFFFIGRAGFHGDLGLGEVAVYTQAALGMMQLAYGGDNETAMRHGAPFVERATRLAARARRSQIEFKGSRPAQDLTSPEIVFEGVHFAYPATERAVLEGIDLLITGGRSLAIVGENGVGKTTLIKLLARLYDPRAGRISVDGSDLSDLEPAMWRSRLAVIFQDFVKYHLTLRDNVGFGSLKLLQDETALADSLADAGGRDLLKRLGWEVPLSPAYPGGVDLSGGEWQKVALARALTAVRGGASVLVLDEPTAHLDVRAEAELFERFLDLTRGLTTILLSHRFSSVRRAERICVLELGRVAEEGTHDELMALNGRYAKMFRFQAERFGASNA